MKFHDELNPVIWDKENDNQMRPEVLAKLKEIANAFIEYIEIPEDAILDMVVTGSSASYNYNEFSDLDLHIIVDYDKIHEDCPLVEGYLGALKNTFNKEHDIYIHGVPVELYAEKKDQGTVHNGLYSVQNEEWIDRPQKITPTDNDAAVEAKFNEIKEMVDKCDDSEAATELLEKIYAMRKAGLAQAGEFCTENLAFKKLRNEGCMDKLREIKKKDIDKQLSLESYNETLEQDVKELTKTDDYYKVDGSRVSIKNGFGSQVELMDLQNLGKKLEKKGYKVYCSNYYIDAKKNESIKEGQDVKILTIEDKEYLTKLLSKDYNKIGVKQQIEDIEKMLKNYVWVKYEKGKKRISSAEECQNEFGRKRMLKYIAKANFGGGLTNGKSLDNYTIYSPDTNLEGVENYNESIKEEFNIGDKVWRKNPETQDRMIGEVIDRSYKDGQEYLTVKFNYWTSHNGTYPAEFFRKLNKNESVNECTITKLYKTIKEAEENDLKVGDVVKYNNVVWVKIKSINGNKVTVSPIHKEDIDSGKFEKEEIVLLNSLRKSNESIKEDTKLNDICKLVTKLYGPMGPKKGQYNLIHGGKNAPFGIKLVKELSGKGATKDILVAKDKQELMDKLTQQLNKNESINENKFFKKELIGLPSKEAKLSVGDKVSINGESGEIIEVKPMKMSDTSTYKIKLDTGKIIWRYEEEIMNESINEDLKTIWKEEMKRDPIIDTADGPIYLQPSEDGKSIEYGTMTNTGMIVDGSVEYDFDYSLDANLDAVYDEITDTYGLNVVPEEDRDLVCTQEKEDRLNSLFTEAVGGIYDPRTILKAYNIEKAWIEKMEHTVGGVTQVLLFIINDYKQILDTHAVNKKDVYTYEPKENEYYLDRTRDTGDVITDYNLEPAQKLVDRWNESKKWSDMMKEELEPVYHYSVEDIDQRGDDFDNAEEAYEQAKEQLSKLGYEVKELNDDGEFEVLGTSTGVAYTGVIYPSNPELDEDVNTLINKVDQAQSDLNDIISKLEMSITEALDEPIEDEYEPIRWALEQYSNLDDCFLEGYVTFDDLRNNYGLSEFTDTQIEECAKEEGYEVEEDKILDPSL